MSNKRVLTGEIYGIRGSWAGGEVVDHLVRGTVFEIGRNERGQACLFANGREYPVDHSLQYDAMQRSKPAPGA